MACQPQIAAPPCSNLGKRLNWDNADWDAREPRLAGYSQKAGAIVSLWAPIVDFCIPGRRAMSFIRRPTLAVTRTQCYRSERPDLPNVVI